MSLDKRMHEGRLRDPWQIPHANRERWKMFFYLKEGMTLISEVGVPQPIEENLKKYRDQVIEVNRSDWYRPMWQTIELGEKDGKMQYLRSPVLDPTTGKQKIDCRLLKVSAWRVGGDI